MVAEIRKGRTFYGLTPRRAIIVFGVFNRHVHSIELASLRDISLLEGPEHVGTILLGAPPTGSNARPAGLRGMFWPGPEPHASRAFLTIDGARTVYDRLMEQQRKCGAG